MPDDNPGLLQVTKRSIKQQSYPIILIAGTELKVADTEPEIVLQSTCIMQMEADGCDGPATTGDLPGPNGEG